MKKWRIHLNHCDHIRKAKTGEEEAIHSSHMRSIREICVKDHGEDEIKGWGNRPLGDRWKSAITENSVWIVDWKGKIEGVGYMPLMETKNKKYGYLHALYLTPEVVGKGFGRKLLTHLINEVKLNGASEIQLDSTITAYDFYKKFGFQDNGQMKKVNIGGYPVRSFPMVLTF